MWPETLRVASSLQIEFCDLEKAFQRILIKAVRWPVNTMTLQLKHATRHSTTGNLGPMRSIGKTNGPKIAEKDCRSKVSACCDSISRDIWIFTFLPGALENFSQTLT